MKNLGTFFLKQLVFRCPFIVLLSCVFLSFAAVPMSVWAANVYIDPSATYNGDGTAGTQAAGAGQVGAFKTWSSVAFSNADDYYQKCGTTATVGLSLPISNIIATSENRVVVGAYYLDGGEQIGVSGNKPIIKRPNMTGDVIAINNNSTYITIENLDLQRGSVCIFGVDADYLLIQNNDIGEGSTWGIRLHGRDRQLYGTEIKNNTIDSHILTYGQVAETNLWDAIQIYKSANNYKIYNNTIKDFGHTGVLLWGLRTGNYTVQNNEIYNNYFDGANSGHFRGFSLTEFLASHNKVYNNYMENMNASCQISSPYNEIYYNIISKVRASGIAANGIGILLTSNGDGNYTHHNKIYNNVIYKTDNPAIVLQNGTPALANLEYNEITNNIFLETGDCKISGSGCNQEWPIMINTWGTTTTFVQNNTFKNNIVYLSGRTTNLVRYRPSMASPISYKTIEQFNAIDGIDGNVSSGNIYADPKLKNPGIGDFSWQFDSPYKNLGIGIEDGVIVGIYSSLETLSVLQPPVGLKVTTPTIQ